MKIEIQTVANPGDIAKERVVLRVDADSELGFFMVLQSTASEDGLGATDGEQRGYWFPNQKVKKGDLVILYSKSGTNSVRNGEGAQKVYFYYWESTKPMWRDGRYACVLVESTDWKVVNFGGPEEDMKN